MTATLSGAPSGCGEICGSRLSARGVSRGRTEPAARGVSSLVLPARGRRFGHEAQSQGSGRAGGERTHRPLVPASSPDRAGVTRRGGDRLRGPARRARPAVLLHPARAPRGRPCSSRKLARGPVRTAGLGDLAPDAWCRPPREESSCPGCDSAHPRRQCPEPPVSSLLALLRSGPSCSRPRGRVYTGPPEVTQASSPGLLARPTCSF